VLGDSLTVPAESVWVPCITRNAARELVSGARRDAGNKKGPPAEANGPEGRQQKRASPEGLAQRSLEADTIGGAYIHQRF